MRSVLALHVGVRDARGRSARSWAVLLFVHPGVIDIQHIGHCACGQHLAFGPHRDAVAAGMQRVQIMGDQKDRQVQRIAQGHDQPVERGGPDRPPDRSEG